MRGQWIGRASGNTQGNITLNLDLLDKQLQGVAIIKSDVAGLPIVFAVVSMPSDQPKGQFEASLAYLDPATSAVLSAEELKAKHPELSFSVTATVTYQFKNKALKIGWKSQLGFTGEADLILSETTRPSEYHPTPLTWREFKTFVESLDYRKHIFRGQEAPWRLRTTFHRSGRFDLGRFAREDVPALYQALSGRTKHLYNIKDADQNGSFLHLAQHYGYPTPLLDWSFSPFVAAYCGFRKMPKDVDPKAEVKIFVFDHINWKRDFNQVAQLATPHPHFSILEFLSLDNERVIPQQALSSVTNVDDVESYIRAKEVENKKTYLRAISLRAGERRSVIQDLSRMGISAGSMFPGLEGTCEEIKERLFPD